MKLVKCKKCGKEYPKGTKFCSDCGTHLKDGIIGFFIAMIFLYFGVELLTMFIPNLVVSSISSFKYGQEFLYESLVVIIILIVMLLSRNSYVFTQKREKLSKSLLLGWPFLVLAFIVLFNSITSLEEFNFFSCLNLILYCITIGLYEEFLCRGWIQNEFIERYGSSKKLVIRSIFLASLIFGGIHFFNLLAGQTFFETLTQVIHATACGFFLGTLYYRTKNIWSVIILHGFWDFAIMLSEHTEIRECSTGVATAGIVADNVYGLLLYTVFYVVMSIILLKDCKCDETIISHKNDEVTEKKNVKTKLTETMDSFKKDKKNFILYGILVVVMIVLILPISFATDEEYEEYYTCYTYEKKTFKEHEIHTFFKYSYDINYTKETTEYLNVETEELNEDGTPVIKQDAVVIKDEIQYKIYLDEKTYESVLENVTTGDKIILDEHFENLYKVVVFENEDSFVIGIHSSDLFNSTIYYAKLNKNELQSTKEYFDTIVDQFKKYELPLLEDIGYIQEVGSDTKYLHMVSSIDDEFIIDEKGNLYILEFDL